MNDDLARAAAFDVAQRARGLARVRDIELAVRAGRHIGGESSQSAAVLLYAHVELPQTTRTLNGEVDTPIVVPFDIIATGTRAADNVVLDLRLNSSLVPSAMPSGIVGCTPTTLGIHCEIGSIAAGSTKHLEFTFLPGMQGYFSFQAAVSASNNQNTRNGTQTFNLNILPSVDASVAVTTSAQTANFGDNVDTGLTGWAQVNGWRGNTPLEKRIEYDLYYIENWSVRLDLKIMWLTVLRGFFHKHAY